MGQPGVVALEVSISRNVVRDQVVVVTLSGSVGSVIGLEHGEIVAVGSMIRKPAVSLVVIVADIDFVLIRVIDRVSHTIVVVKVLREVVIPLIVSVNCLSINNLNELVSVERRIIVIVVVNLELVSINIIVGVPELKGLVEIVEGLSRVTGVSIGNLSVYFVTNSVLGVEGILVGGDGHNNIISSVVVSVHMDVVSSHLSVEIVKVITIITNVTIGFKLEEFRVNFSVEVLEPFGVISRGVVVGRGELWGFVVGEGNSVWLRESVNRVRRSVESSMDVSSVVGLFVWQSIDFPIVNLSLSVVDGSSIVVVIVLIFAVYLSEIIAPNMVPGIVRLVVVIGGVISFFFWPEFGIVGSPSIIVLTVHFSISVLVIGI